MGTLKQRRLFFGTRDDLLPGLAAVESRVAVDYVPAEMRDDANVIVVPSLASSESLGVSRSGDTAQDERYYVFRRGKAPSPQPVPQRRGGTKYVIDATPDCIILRPGGMHAASGTLVAGEVQLPLDPSRTGEELFALFVESVLRSFVRVRSYSVGPEALRALRSGQRLVTIGQRSPREYDLAEE